MIKKFLALTLSLSIAFSLTACTGSTPKKESSKSNKEQTKKENNSSKPQSQTSESKSKNTNNEKKETKIELTQYSEMKDGEEIAVLETTMGTIKFRLFPKEAPKAVENFKKLIEKNYYNGVVFHRVINNFMIQGGDPKGTGTGGESIWGKYFEDEFSQNLHNFRGALSMANAGPNTNGSQFFIVQNNKVQPNIIEQMKQLNDPNFSEGVIKKYEKVGGTPHLDFRHTVFGHVISGMDIVDKIATVETDDKDKPKQEIKINKAYIEKHKKTK